eukprot:scaffold29.g5956.t1
MASSLADARNLAGRSLYSLGTAASSVAVSAGSLASRSLRAVSSLAGGGNDRELITSVRFDTVSDGLQDHSVLLIGYNEGFQVWLLGAADGAAPQQLASRREGPVRLLAALPPPRAGPSDVLRDARPLLAVVPGADQNAPPASPSPSSGGGCAAAERAAADGQQGAAAAGQHCVRLYSLASHGFVRSLAFHHAVTGVQASERLVVVALPGQLQAFDAATLQHTFTCLTYAPPAAARPAFMVQTAASGGGGGGGVGGGVQAAAAAEAPPSVPFALGPRWLAYASDHPVPTEASQAVAQRVPLRSQSSNGAARRGGGGGGAAGGTGPANAGAASGLTAAAVSEAALAAAQKGGQQLKAGLTAADAAVAGTVLVRDVTSRRTVAHFRAHTSALAALAFSPGGDLLATASVRGHSVHIFRILPPAGGLAAGRGSDAGGGRTDVGAATHLYCLHRGVTAAAIRGVAFAPDAAWVAVCSGRGTAHLFRTVAAAAGAGWGSAAPGGAAADGKDGVLGQGERLVAVGRARRPGLLSGGVAGAATSAALSLYGHSSEPAPVAAAFLPAGGSAGSSPTSVRACGGDGGASTSLCVIAADGLLTQHLLRPGPAAVSAAAGRPAGEGGGSATGGAVDAEGGAAANGSGTAAAQGAAGDAPVLEECERWDVCRHHSWPEMEDALPSVAPAGAGLGGTPAEPSALRPASAAGLATVVAWEEAGGGAGQQQAWLAQAESVPCAGGAPPLWQDPQFRFCRVRPSDGAANSSIGAQLSALYLGSPAQSRPGSSAG